MSEEDEPPLMNIIYRDTTGKQVKPGTTYILRLSFSFLVASRGDEKIKKFLGEGKEVRVIKVEYNKRFGGVDAWYEYIDDEGGIYEPQWTGGMVVFEPCTGGMCSISGGKRSKRRKKRRRTRKN
jgi:hypothetical protein